jgi:PleD family two-component response regulator
VVFVEHWLPPAVALGAADEALLRAKRDGRDRVAVGEVPAHPLG